MKIQIRNETATIEGYVNAVERFSKVLYDTRGKFIEKIMPNAFAKALEKNSDVLALLNHDYDRVIARTGDGTAKLYEDNIGLHAKIEVSDKELIKKAQEGKLRGWSFGFSIRNCALCDEAKSHNIVYRAVLAFFFCPSALEEGR